MGLVIVVALYRLTIGLVETLVLESLHPLEHTVFQRVFGQIMTLLIALEFNHTLRYVAADVRGMIQARIVIVIAILALARKAIILELSEVTPAQVAGLAGLTLALGVTYRLIRDRDDRMVGREARGGEPPAARMLTAAPRTGRGGTAPHWLKGCLTAAQVRGKLARVA